MGNWAIKAVAAYLYLMGRTRCQHKGGWNRFVKVIGPNFRLLKERCPDCGWERPYVPTVSDRS